jgi:hypothetical protein
VPAAQQHDRHRGTDEGKQHIRLGVPGLKFLKLLPGNRIRLLVSPTFAWLPDGPIQRYFKRQAQLDYFQSTFDGEGELLFLINGVLSAASRAATLAKLRRLAQEFSETAAEDARLPLE